MGHQYAGVSTSYPTDFTIPDDGDAEAAVSVNVALQALGDRSAYANVLTTATIPVPALNWNGIISVGFSPSAIGWSDIEQAWYVCANASALVGRSGDYGKTWSGATNLPAATSSAGTDIAVDTAGNICFANGANITEGPFVAYGTLIAWTAHTSAIGASGGNAANIVYEPVNARWAVVGGGTSSTPWIYTSTNRATWTQSTTPWVASATSGLTLGAGNGILVATFLNALTSFRVMRSADGGVTWTNDQQITQNAGITMLSGVPTTRPIWSASDSLWYIAVSQASPRKTQVFSSPDGITWTTAATLLTNDCRFLSLACIGALIIAMNDDGRVFCSVNKGVTWLRCQYLGNIPPTTTPLLLGQSFKAGGSGAMVICGANSITSQRLGLPTTPA